MCRILAWTVACLCLLPFFDDGRADEMIWIEGENGHSSGLDHNDWWEAVRPEGLSNRDSVASFSEWYEFTGTVEYDLRIPTEGSYNLWLRVALGSGYALQVDDRKWIKIDTAALRESGQDRRNVALDAKTDARYYVWWHASDLPLDAGGHTLTIQLGGDQAEKRFGAVDVIALTREEFTPNGPFRPGEANPNEVLYPQDSTWAFDPAEDSLSDEALLDLRDLNEDVAGESGFVGLGKDGMSFVRGDGTPIRLWGGTEYAQRELDPDGLKYHAEFLAKRGVNVVRWHGDLPANPSQVERQSGKTTQITDIDEKELDEAFKLVAAMKESGIYTVLSPYWGPHTKIEDNWNIPDPLNGNLAGLVFWVPEVQEAYKGYLRALYTRPNPYTGIPLKDEPAVAVIQLQNEDSMLFYTMSSVEGEPRRMLRHGFLDWLQARYGSVDEIRKAWQGYEYNVFNPDWNQGLPELMHLWDFTRAGIADKSHISGFMQRRADQLEFFARTMYGFNSEIAKFLREELGCKQLINAGNWRTVDSVLVDDAERWSYTANEVIAKNHYFNSLHTGINNGWQILYDSIFTNVSALKHPRLLPTNIRQVVGHPFILSEGLWVPPNLYQAEAPLVVATQQSLNGIDAFLWFSNDRKGWADPSDGWSMTKWTYNTPTLLGQFPAAALIFRKRLLQEGEPVVIERRSLEGLWDGTYPVIAEEAAFDPNRDDARWVRESANEGAVDPLAFLLGPVLVEYDSDEQTRISKHDSLISREEGVVRSITDEITLDYENGIYIVKAPGAQAAAGFLGEAGTIDLGDALISTRNDYAAITLVSMDDKPLASSGRVLVQLASFARPSNWKVEKIEINIGSGSQEAFRLMNVGTAPWQVKKLDADITLRNEILTTATVLDPNGFAVRTIPLNQADGLIHFVAPKDALYVMLSSG